MKLLALDMSTSATGWALFENGKLVEHGVLVPKIPGIHKLKYPRKALACIIAMNDAIQELINRTLPDSLVIEEVNRGINRIAQKSLDALHFFVLRSMQGTHQPLLESLVYVDSNGAEGWRPRLGLRLSQADKAENKKTRRKDKKAAVINWKTIAVRWVISKYGLDLSSDNDPGTDGDIADAVCLGHAHLFC